MRRVLVCALLALGFTAAASSATAQGGGSVRGNVTGADSHDPVIGARIAVQQPERVALTDSRGAYVIRDLPAGQYEITVTAIGRKPFHTNVTVNAGQAAALDVALEVGPLMLSSVVVTATRSPTEASQVATTVNVLTPEHIVTSPARESQDLLREIPGVELPRTSSLVGGSAQIVSIRGVDEGRTAVLFDGIPVTDAWGEWVDWGRVPKGMLDRVEVLEGGNSNLYGNGAIGGVISFFSRPLAPGSGVATIDGGSRDARHGFLSMGLPLVGALTANISGDYLEGGGYTLLDPAKRGTIDIPSQIVQRNGYARITYAPSAKLSAFVTGHKFSDSRYLGTPYGFTSRDLGSIDLGVNYGLLATGEFSLRAWDGRHEENQRQSAVRTNFASCTPAGTAARACEDSSVVARIPSHDWGASLLWTRGGLLGLESFSVGGDFRHMQGSFDETDYNTTCPGANCGKFLRTIQSGGDQSLSGVFAQAVAAPIDRLRIEAGARFDHWSNDNAFSNDAIGGNLTYPDRSKDAFSPRLGARVEVLSNLSVHGALYKAFRAPNLAELYRKQINANASQVTLPNPDLKAESGRGWEGGLNWQPIRAVQFKGTYYIADYNDFNVPVTFAANARPALCGTAATCRQRQNINKSRSKGGEAYLAIRPIEQLFISGSVNYDDARVVANDSTNGRHINRVPSPKQTVRVTYTSRLLGSWTGIWKHEGFTTTLQGAKLAPFTVIDANAQREIVPGILGFVSVENVTDEQYQVNLSGTGTAALISFGMPRTFRVGVTVTR